MTISIDKEVAVCGERRIKADWGENLKTVFRYTAGKEQNDFLLTYRAYVEHTQYGENIKQIDCERK